MAAMMAPAAALASRVLPLLLLALTTTPAASDPEAVAAAGGGGSSVQLMLESLKEIASCPGSFLRCMLSTPCRATMACAGHCVHGPTMNLTCFVPCTFGNDQHAFNAFTDCVMRAKPDPDDPGVESLPAQGQCLDVGGAVKTDFDPAGLEGEWYVAAGASSLEAYDCQKNRVARRNATHWQIDEYYQGYIDGIGFKWAQSRQVFHPLAPEHPGLMAWRPADGASGYEAIYHTLAAHDDYHIFYYCAPLRPTPLYWSSFILYSRTAQPSARAMRELQGLLDRYKWTTPLTKVNHEGCQYRIADPDALHTALTPEPHPLAQPSEPSQPWWRRGLLFPSQPPIAPFSPPAPSTVPTTVPSSNHNQQPSSWLLFTSFFKPFLANLWGAVIPPSRQEQPIVVAPEGEGRDEMGEL